MVDELIREPNANEIRDFIPLITPQGRTQTPEQRFNEKLNNELVKAAKRHLPFAEKAARDDLKDIANEISNIAKRSDDLKEVEKAFKRYDGKMDWSKYSDLKNFEVIGEGSTFDEQLSKRHNLQIFLKWTRYKYKGYSNEYTVYEDPNDAINRARSQLEEDTLKRAKAVMGK